MASHSALSKVLSMALVLVAGCSAVHRVGGPCLPASEARDCRADEVCRETLNDGEYLCMQTCDQSADCTDGAACINRIPGLPRVCWIGGPLERNETCLRHTSCSFGMLCSRDRVCREICYEEGSDCDDSGLRCERGACVVPVEPGAPCNYAWNCSRPYNSCRPETLYTCQAACWSPTLTGPTTCPDGTECTDDTECLDREPAAVDQCTRTETGVVGCDPRWPQACIMTTLGVRRCTWLCDSFQDTTSCNGNCLPDPEDPSTFVCWLGGTTDRGEACESHYECRSGGCNAAGVCARRCGEGLTPCPPTRDGVTQVCQDGVCTPEAT